ncbi:MAG: FAD-binding protein [Clostridia bacterium]|nr:FAD-binding protein [Clostridia bacterium]
MKRHFDIAVIGAGPAGANFVRLADSEQKSILVIHNEAWKKPCGGLLSPDAQRVLASYDAVLPSDVLASPQIFAVRVIDIRSGLVRRYPRHYLNMKRDAFDAWLRSLMGKHITYVNGRCVKLTDEGKYFRIRLSDGTEYTADTLVGADGASSIVRRTFFGKEKCRRYTAIQQQFQAENADPFYSCIYDGKTSPACSWILFKDGIMTYGGAFETKNSRKAFEEQKKRLIAGGFISAKAFEYPIKTEACEVLCPSFRGYCTGNDRIFLIGEAAGFISASSFEGISYALLSGEALAKSIDTAHPAMTYRAKTAKLRLKAKEKSLKRDILASDILREIIMRSGITAIHSHRKEMS